jgi:hypothetical protein
MADNLTTTTTLSSVPDGTVIATKLATHSGDGSSIQVVQPVGVSGSEGSYTLTEIATNLGMLVETTATVVDLTLSLDTGGAYADGDVLAATQELASAVRASAGTGMIQSIGLIDDDDQGQALDIVVLDSNVSIGSENSAVSIADGDADKILGIVEVTGSDYVDLVNSQWAQVRNVGMVVQPATGTSLYIAAISRGTGTYTASGITLRIGILQD